MEGNRRWLRCHGEISSTDRTEGGNRSRTGASPDIKTFPKRANTEAHRKKIGIRSENIRSLVDEFPLIMAVEPMSHGCGRSPKVDKRSFARFRNGPVESALSRYLR